MKLSGSESHSELQQVLVHFPAAMDNILLQDRDGQSEPALGLACLRVIR